MEKDDNFSDLIKSSRCYYNCLNECSKMWTEACQKARENERDLLVLSEQLRCLAMQDETNLNFLEPQKTFGRVVLLIEEKSSELFSLLENVVRCQEELTNLRLRVEKCSEALRQSEIIQKLFKNIYVSWLLLQLRSSSTSSALKAMDYKSPESMKQLIQCIYGLDNHKYNLEETLEVTENLLRTLELFE